MCTFSETVNETWHVQQVVWAYTALTGGMLGDHRTATGRELIPTEGCTRHSVPHGIRFFGIPSPTSHRSPYGMCPEAKSLWFPPDLVYYQVLKFWIRRAIYLDAGEVGGEKSKYYRCLCKTNNTIVKKSIFQQLSTVRYNDLIIHQSRVDRSGLHQKNQ